MDPKSLGHYVQTLPVNSSLTRTCQPAAVSFCPVYKYPKSYHTIWGWTNLKNERESLYLRLNSPLEWKRVSFSFCFALHTHLIWTVLVTHGLFWTLFFIALVNSLISLLIITTQSPTPLSVLDQLLMQKQRRHYELCLVIGPSQCVDTLRKGKNKSTVKHYSVHTHMYLAFRCICLYPLHQLLTCIQCSGDTVAEDRGGGSMSPAVASLSGSVRRHDPANKPPSQAFPFGRLTVGVIARSLSSWVRRRPCYDTRDGAMTYKTCDVFELTCRSRMKLLLESVLGSERRESARYWEPCFFLSPTLLIFYFLFKPPIYVCAEQEGEREREPGTRRRDNIDTLERYGKENEWHQEKKQNLEPFQCYWQYKGRV